MQTVADLITTARDTDAPLFVSSGGAADHSYESFLTTTWKAGNLLRHYGVRPGDAVAVVVGPNEPEADDQPGHMGVTPTPLLAVIGGLLAGGSVDLDPVTAVDAKVLVAPAAWIERYTPGPGTKPIAYGADATDPTVAQLERESWSENPVAPPVELDPMTTAFGGSDPHTHGDLLVETRRIVAGYNFDSDTRVGLAAPMTPAVFVAGVLAPIMAGGTIVLGQAEQSPRVDVIVGSVPDGTGVQRIDPSTVLPGHNG